MNVENPDKENSSELIKTERYKDTPFTLVEQNGKHFIGVAQYRVSEEYQTKEKLIELIEKKDWNLIMTMMFVSQESRNKIYEVGD